MVRLTAACGAVPFKTSVKSLNRLHTFRGAKSSWAGFRHSPTTLATCFARYHTGQQRPDHQVVGFHVGKFPTLVGGEADKLLLPQVGQLAHGVVNQPVQVAADKAGMLSGHNHVAAKERLSQTKT